MDDIRYLRLLEREFHREPLKSRPIHCGETTFRMLDNGQGPNSKDYMWMYYTCERYGSPPIFTYNHQPTRKAKNPRNLLEGYEGILITDGYQEYHTLMTKHPDELKVARYWTYAKRKFAEIVKSIVLKTASDIIVDKESHRIAAIYHVDNMYKESSLEGRLDNHKICDFYFKNNIHQIKFFLLSKTGKATQLSEELYLNESDKIEFYHDVKEMC